MFVRLGRLEGQFHKIRRSIWVGSSLPSLTGSSPMRSRTCIRTQTTTWSALIKQKNSGRAMRWREGCDGEGCDEMRWDGMVRNRRETRWRTRIVIDGGEMNKKRDSSEGIALMLLTPARSTSNTGIRPDFWIRSTSARLWRQRGKNGHEIKSKGNWL